jgi:hypothetical protein
MGVPDSTFINDSFKPNFYQGFFNLLAALACIPKLLVRPGRTEFFNEASCRLVQKRRRVAISNIASGRQTANNIGRHRRRWAVGFATKETRGKREMLNHKERKELREAWKGVKSRKLPANSMECAGRAVAATALFVGSPGNTPQRDPKRCRRCALPPHSTGLGGVRVLARKEPRAPCSPQRCLRSATALQRAGRRSGACPERTPRSAQPTAVSPLRSATALHRVGGQEVCRTGFRGFSVPRRKC